MPGNVRKSVMDGITQFTVQLLPITVGFTYPDFSMTSPWRSGLVCCQNSYNH